MEPSESTKQAAHDIMLYTERCRPGRMNQFTVEEIIQRAMNPDPATNPAPETPTPHEWSKQLCNRRANGLCSTRSCLIRGGWKPGSPPNYNLATCEVHEAVCQLERITDLERALAEAKRENEQLRDRLAGRAVDDSFSEHSWRQREAELENENERLKADKARIDWLEAQKIVSLNKSALREEWEIESVQDDFRARRYTGDLRAAIDAARTTQEGQG